MPITVLLDPSAPSLARAAECLRAGGLVAFPTETVYGLGANALDADAVRRVFDAKGRPANDPLIVHVGGVDDLRDLVALGTMRDRVHALASRFWPGPLTLILPKSPRVPGAVTAGLATVAVRVPSHPVARALLDAAALPIAAPSANLFSRTSPTRAEHVLQDLDGRIDIVIDGGPTTVGLESTVLDLTTQPPVILRPGAVTLEEVRELLPDVAANAHSAGGGGNAPLRSPGLLEKHYAPRAPLTMYEGPRASEALAVDAADALRRGLRPVIIGPTEMLARFDRAVVQVLDLGSSGDPAGMASRLYSALRDADAGGADVILAFAFEGGTGLTAALHDRLRRAAAGRIVHT